MRISDWSSDVCSSDLEFTLADDGLRDLIRYYTREAGVRTLEREIARPARKALRSILEGKADKVVITPANIGDYAGVRKLRFGVGEEEDQNGATTGLAGTEGGGGLLTVEAGKGNGKGEIKAAGKRGDGLEGGV